MSLLHRKALAGIGVAAAAIASTAMFSSPAWAASAGLAQVVGTNTVQFNALLGQSNALVITISGRTVTLDDSVALKPGRGCKKVDSTKVKCTTSKATAKLSAALGDKNDRVTNKTSVYLLADGGAGNDVLIGGSGKDQLQGGAGNDTIYGGAGIDILFGDAGNDTVYGGAGDDTVYGGAGNDTVYGGAGIDTILGEAGNDLLKGDAGDDVISGDAGNDTIYGGAGDDGLLGDFQGAPGNDTIYGEAGVDVINGDGGNDKISGGDGSDLVLAGGAGNDTITGDAGDDLLVGESLDANGSQFGSATALDVLDGGTNVTVSPGDICLVLAAGTTSNCEFVNPAAAAVDAARFSSAQLSSARLVGPARMLSATSVLERASAARPGSAE